MTPQFPSSEQIIRLKCVRTLPCFDVRSRPCYHTVRYWTKWGIRGVKLESRRVGGRIETTIEAVERFLQRTNATT